MEEYQPVCRDCAWFDDKTHFCRLNPPQPVIFYDRDKRAEKTTSKFPVITKPDMDYCSNWSDKADN